jgi:hypothetical protein
MRKNIFIERWKAESPDFFKKLQKVAFSVGGSAIAVRVADTTLDLSLAPWLLSVISYIIAACVAIAGTAQLTKK